MSKANPRTGPTGIPVYPNPFSPLTLEEKQNLVLADFVKDRHADADSLRELADNGAWFWGSDLKGQPILTDAPENNIAQLRKWLARPSDNFGESTLTLHECWRWATRQDVTCRAVALSAGMDCVFAVLESLQGNILLTLDALSGVERARVTLPQGDIGYASFSPNCHQVAIRFWDRSIRTSSASIWDIENGKERGPFRPALTQGDSIHTVAFSPNNNLLAVGTQQGTTILLNMSTWKEQRIRSSPGYNRIVAFSPDGLLANFAGHEGGDQEIEFRYVHPRQRRAFACSYQGNDVEDIAFSRNGKRMASSSQPVILLWDMESKSKQLIHTLNFPNSRATITSLACSPNGQLTAASFIDATHLDSEKGIFYDIDGICLWNEKKPASHFALKNVLSLAFPSSNHNHLAAGLHDSRFPIRFFAVAPQRK